MIRQSLTALNEKAQEPLESDTHRATHATQGNPLHQQAFNQSSFVFRDEILLEALDELTVTVMTLMVLFTCVNVPIFRHLLRDGKSSEQFVWHNLLYRCIWFNKLSTGI